MIPFLPTTLQVTLMVNGMATTQQPISGDKIRIGPMVRIGKTATTTMNGLMDDAMLLFHASPPLYSLYNGPCVFERCFLVPFQI